MSDDDRTCEYVLDPDDPETWGGERGDTCYAKYWECPFNSAGTSSNGEQRCVFHIENEKTKESLIEKKFIEVLRGETLGAREDNIRIYAGTFGSIKLPSDVQIGGNEKHHEIDLSHCEFDGGVSFKNANFNCRLVLTGSSFHSNFVATDALFHDLFAADVEFYGETHFRQVDIETGAKFSECAFSSRTYFNNSEIRNAKFDLVRFEGNWTSFRNTTFVSGVDFSESKFVNKVDLSAIYEEPASFEDVEAPDARFKNCNLSNSNFNGANLTDANFDSTDLRQTNLEATLLSRADLSGVDLRGARLSGAVLGDIRIDDKTKFLGHHSDDENTSKHTISAIRSTQTCIYDSDYEDDNEHEDNSKAKSVYRALEELGRKHARPRLQTRSFVRRQDLQKKNYWDDATAEEISLEERFIAGARWSRAGVARVTLLYGESPWRIITAASLFVVTIGLIYPAFGWVQPRGGVPITYSRIFNGEPELLLESIYFSALTFTTLGMGDYAPVAGWGQVLATLNTALGAILVALLVFVLGRRAAR